jgi:hypothetical protein
MELNKLEIADLRYLREFYGWDDKDAREVMRSISETPHGARYYTILAAAHRAGYMQDAANGFVRLQAWCAEQGLPDPFGPEFDVAALDALAVEPRLKAA